jgi:TonB family protein
VTIPLKINIAQDVQQEKIPKRIKKNKKAIHAQAPQKLEDKPSKHDHSSHSQVDKEIETHLHKYIERVLLLLNEHKRYPQRARFLRQEGTVELQIKINKNGEILNIEVLKSTPYEILVNSAVSLVKSIGRFPEIPSEFQVEQLNIHAPIYYKLGQ